MKKKLLLTALAAGSVVTTSAHAAIDQTTVDGIVTGISADAGIAIAAGFAILAVVLGARVGFSLVKTFISAGSS